MYRRLLIFATKLLIKLLRLLGKNGSALPGLIIERLYPNFLNKVLSPVEQKIVLVTGTNGKTTTTKMLVAGLRASGSRVITNGTGSNMTRGLIAAVIEDMTYFGSLRPTDWFVFEVDEAYGPVLTKNLEPKLLVALNVLRDQLDRYGEIDTTARFIEKTAQKCELFIYNVMDPLLSDIGDKIRIEGAKAFSFGVSKKLLQFVKNEQTTHGDRATHSRSDYTLQDVLESGTKQAIKIATIMDNSDTQLMSLPVRGFHNALNAAAVYAAVDQLLSSESSKKDSLEGISKMPTPFGRGEQLIIKDKKITVALVKNPSGFASNLTTFVKDSEPKIVLFVVNDRIADGRDVSWLWDVNFTTIMPKHTIIYTSGTRANDMALRLKHDKLKSTAVLSVEKAISAVMKQSHKNIVVIPTYTALFEVRSALSKYGKVPRIW